MHRPRTLLSLVILLALALPAAAQATPIAAPGAPTAVREYQGTLVFSQFDPATSQYRLAVRRAGAPAPELLPIEPADREFDADIGPDSQGRPQLIYTRCDETCDLFVYSLASNTGERTVRNANDPEHNDVTPTLWRGRIAWARIYGEQRDRKVIVYTKTLTAPRSRPSTRLPGVPSRRCSPTTGHAVEALELWGDNLGQIVRYDSNGCSGLSQTEVRLVRVSTRAATQIAFQTTGLSGQSLAGPSFSNGWLAWYRACLGDPSACQGGKANPWRYNLRHRGYAKGVGGPVRVSGFADTMALHYRVESCSPETSSPEFNAACRLEEVPAPDYAKARKPG
jgi:hypothetical protein